jgi:hypothetical protein
MDSHGFDRLTRSLAAASRRDALRLLAGSAAVGTASVWGWQETAARCRKSRRCPQPIGCCPKGTRCLHGACFSRSICPANATCNDSIQCHSTDLNACYCGVTKEDRPICYREYPFCSEPIPCNKSSECDPGLVCLKTSGCCGPSTFTGTCVRPCPSPAVA